MPPGGGGGDCPYSGEELTKIKTKSNLHRIMVRSDLRTLDIKVLPYRHGLPGKKPSVQRAAYLAAEFEHWLLADLNKSVVWPIHVNYRDPD